MINAANPHQPVKEIVVVGGGFGGISFARKLARDPHYRITLVDKNNYNFFPPLIYQVATGFLDPASISYPFRKLFRKRGHLHFRLGELRRVDPVRHTCYLSSGEIPYDHLVFATGTVSNFFGNENIRRNAIPMKNVNDALQMRNFLLQILEKASHTTDERERRKLLTFVVAGGGPTGVEVSGMLGELRKCIILKDYPELKGAKNDIYLVEGRHRLLAQMSERSHEDAQKALTRLGVKAIMNTLVKDFDNDRVTLSDGQVIEAKSLIWTAGVTAKAFEGMPGDSIGRGNRMLTDAYNRVKGVEDIFSIGDACLQETDPAFPKGHPQLAQVAIQQGARLAKNFSAMAQGKPLKPFRYHDKGTMAIIGRKRAVVDLVRPNWHIGGIPARFLWLYVHLTSLVAFPNKVRTLYNWIFAYITRDQSLRMIIRPEPRSAAPRAVPPGEVPESAAMR